MRLTPSVGRAGRRWDGNIVARVFLDFGPVRQTHRLSARRIRRAAHR